jgi:hypothetical protein
MNLTELDNEVLVTLDQYFPNSIIVLDNIVIQIKLYHLNTQWQRPV